jgi:hypothetical protein
MKTALQYLLISCTLFTLPSLHGSQKPLRKNNFKLLNKLGSDSALQQECKDKADFPYLSPTAWRCCYLNRTLEKTKNTGTIRDRANTIKNLLSDQTPEIQQQEIEKFNNLGTQLYNTEQGYIALAKEINAMQNTPRP